MNVVEIEVTQADVDNARRRVVGRFLKYSAHCALATAVARQIGPVEHSSYLQVCMKDGTVYKTDAQAKLVVIKFDGERYDEIPLGTVKLYEEPKITTQVGASRAASGVGE